MAASRSARSPAVRAMGPSTANGSHGAETGQRGTTPGVGRSPSTPLHAAGLRSDPPRSLPSASGTMRQASATAAPPLEPPAERAGFQGLRVGAEDRIEGVRARAPLRRVGLAQHDRAGLSQAPDLQRIGDRHVIAVGRRAIRRADARGVLQILVCDRQAVQQRQLLATGAPAVGLVRSRECALGRARHDRVDERLDALDTRQVRRDELTRRARARPQCTRLLGRRQQTQLVQHVGSGRGHAIAPHAPMVRVCALVVMGRRCRSRREVLAP